jgi:hypothetical protein
MNTDIQIYIKNLKKYIESSDDARELFLSGVIELDDFMSEVELVAMKNVEEGRDPQLTKTQYEQIRQNKGLIKPEIPTFKMDGFPPIFLN